MLCLFACSYAGALYLILIGDVFLDTIIGYFIPLVSIGLGLFILSLDFRLLRKKDYIDAFAKIISSAKYERFLKTQNNAQVTYGVKLEYEYEIEGKKYLSKNIFKNAESYSTSDPNWASTFIKDFPVGKNISIKVKADNPADAYIIEKAPRSWLLNILSLIAIIAGVLMLIYKTI